MLPATQQGSRSASCRRVPVRRCECRQVHARCQAQRERGAQPCGPASPDANGPRLRSRRSRVPIACSNPSPECSQEGHAPGNGDPSRLSTTRAPPKQRAGDQGREDGEADQPKPDSDTSRHRDLLARGASKALPPPNGSRLSCGRLGPPAHPRPNDRRCSQTPQHNGLLYKRSRPPASSAC